MIVMLFLVTFADENNYMNMRLLKIVFIILLASCSSKTNTEIISILDRAEDCIEQFPDSSLHLLNLLNIKDISSDVCRARYALLKSIALDKNYIDVTDDSLTSIAVSYYIKHGTAEEKLKSFLYNGNVFVNAKDYDEAMNNFLRAEEYVHKCNNLIIVGRLYSIKSILYNTIFDYQTAIGQAKLASQYFLKGGDTTRFLNNLNNISVMMNNSSMFDSADDYLKMIEQYWYRLTPSQKAVYYSVKLAQSSKDDKDVVKEIIEKMLALQLEGGKINWLAVSEAYYMIGDYNNSMESIKNHKLTGGITDATYYLMLSNIYSKIGEYEMAYKFLVKSDNLLQGRYYSSTQTDAKFMEERYVSQMSALKQKYLIVILVLGILAIVLLLFLLCKHHKAVLLAQRLKVIALEDESKLREKELEHLALEKENYEIKCIEALREQEKLKNFIIANKDRNNLNPNILSLIKQRLAVLDKFIVANISSSFSKDALKELNELMHNRGHFLDSTRLIFTLSHPQFIECLASKGLTEREIACCCLYCIGLNGNEISNYLAMKSFYNISAVIRRKLCIERSMNIDTYLRKLLSHFE